MQVGFEAVGLRVASIEELDFRDRYRLVLGMDTLEADVLYDGSGRIKSVQPKGHCGGEALKAAHEVVMRLPPEVVAPAYATSLKAGDLEAAHKQQLEAGGLEVIDSWHTQFQVTYNVEDDDGRSATISVTYNGEGRLTWWKRKYGSDESVANRAASAIGFVI